MSNGGWDFGGKVRVQDEENSELAAESVEGIAPTQRAVVWSLVRARGPMATWEMEEALDGLHQSVSATVNHLHRMGALVNTGTKNRTRTGRAAWIYRAVTRADADAALGISRVDPPPPGSPPVSPLRTAPDRPQPTQTDVRPDLVRVEREGKGDAYISRKLAANQSLDAERARTQEDRIATMKATPRVDPSTHRLSFGGPQPCDKCSATGGNLWEACFACGGTGLR